MKKMMIMVAAGLMAAMTFAAQYAAKTQDGAQCNCQAAKAGHGALCPCQMAKTGYCAQCQYQMAKAGHGALCPCLMAKTGYCAQCQYQMAKNGHGAQCPCQMAKTGHCAQCQYLMAKTGHCAQCPCQMAKAGHCAQCECQAEEDNEDMSVIKISRAKPVADMRNLLTVPMGRRILAANMKEVERDGIIQVEIPREWTEGVKCAALRVSHLLLDKNTKRICGALGSYMYPTVAEGAYALTNEIFSAVWDLTNGKGLGVPLQLDHKKGTCETAYFWKPNPRKKEMRSLYVWGFVTSKRQMGIGCLLHTDGDGLRAGLVLPGMAAKRKTIARPTSQKQNQERKKQ